MMIHDDDFHPYSFVEDRGFSELMQQLEPRYQIPHRQTWGQVHEYLYLSTLKYKFESTCTLLKYFLNYPSVLVLILKYFCQVLEYLKYF